MSSFISLQTWVLLGSVLLTSVACVSPSVGPANPRPNVAISTEQAPTSLELDASIPDAFSTPSSGSVMAIPVKGWHSSLKAGFDNAYQPGGTSGHRLHLLVAELSFAPATVSANHNVSAVRAQIRYKARLLDDAGQELALIAGTVEAREANSSPREEAMTDNAGKAIEALYEQLSAKLAEVN